ncbi:MAG: tetratricopeptide (TPR) repeat protein [Cognaticolwellia sp.]|jgi:tetratricopeptide (TPR) repeat protein
MLSLFVPLVLLLPTAQASASDRNAVKAEKAFGKDNYDKALKKCSKALDQDASNSRAAAVCGTVLYLWGASGGDRELAQAGSDLLDGVAFASPDQPFLQLYRQVKGAALIKAPNFPCGEAESQAWEQAEQAFMRQDMIGARKQYQVAAKGCENPTLWTYYGDTYFAEQDYEQAFLAYEHALEIDPYHWPALRFIGDGHVRQGDQETGYGWVARALAANPVYEYGWIYLEDSLDPRVKQVRGLSLPPITAGSIVVEAGGLPPFTADVRMIYQIGMQDAAGQGSSHERRLNALEMSLSFVEENGKLEDPGMTLWALLAEARDAGHFEEAVFILLLNEDMVPAFMDYREGHMDSLAAYVVSLLD